MSFAGERVESNRWQMGSGPPLGSHTNAVPSPNSEQTSEPVYTGWKGLIGDEILDAGIACSREGWDGENAVPISAGAVGRALNLIYLAPDTIHPPEVVPSADGEIAFEWRKGRERMIALVPHDDDVIFAAILGPLNNRESACKPLKNGWPLRVTELLLEYFTYARPSSPQRR